MCIEDNVDPHACIWYGMPPSCNTQCPAESILVFKGSDWINGFARGWGWASGLTCRNSYSFVRSPSRAAPLWLREPRGVPVPERLAPSQGQSAQRRLLDLPAPGSVDQQPRRKRLACVVRAPWKARSRRPESATAASGRELRDDHPGIRHDAILRSGDQGLRRQQLPEACYLSSPS